MITHHSIKVNIMTTFKLIAATSIRSSLAQAVELKRNATISALFHGIVSSNVSFTSDMKREDAADFDVTLRVLLPIRYSSEDARYNFDGKKAFKSAEVLGLALEGLRLDYKAADKEGKAAIAQTFYDACIAYAKANDEKAKANSLSADKLLATAMSRITGGIKAAKEQGATDADIMTLLIKMGIDVQAALTLPAAPVETVKAA